ncbi:RAD50 [Enterospora canceri]|uniref:RAD50 n=1 Tax=Enterospora canceri TaxID=1081671 RepID=A0A1Y1S5S5_9MICR|nr:RAD50 [Enterospora canceri]
MSENAGEILRFDKACNILCKMISRTDLNEEVVMEHLNQLEMKIAQLTREMKAKETEMNVAAYENKKIKEKEAELTERMNSLANRFRNIAPAKYQIGRIFADFESIQKRIIQNEAMVEVLEKNMIYSGETKACILCTGKEITDQYFKKLHEIVLRDEEINNHKQETERLRRSIDINLTMERAKLMNELSVEYNKHKENLANIKPNLNLKTLQDQHDMITRKYEEMNHSYAEFKQNHIIYKEFININRNNIDKELENIKTVMNSRKAQLNNLKAELKIRYKQREIKQKQTEIHSKQLEVQKAKRIIDQHDFNQLTKCEMHLIAYENELDEISDGFSRFKAISEVKLQEIDQISRILEDISINATLHKNNPFNWKHYEEVKCAYEKASSNHERELTTKMQITGDLNNLYKSKTEIEQLIKFKNALAIIEKHRHITERYDKVTHNSLKEKLITLTQSQNQLINYQSRIEGEIKQLDLVKTAREIELKEYANVTEEFNKLALEIKIFEFQVEDVQKAVVALEKTIIEYHAAKIEEVNTALCDLWTNTYSNKDISRIELKSDLTATSYSYRMVMYNQSEIPLDMRGRCSAGQKMIASILFRMALAECFSDANLITLDEPTTNLDATNMEKLAETLNNLLLTKSDMQLVVITHDEEFVGMINRVGSKSIYKIEKDSRGMSNIKIDTISY